MLRACILALAVCTDTWFAAMGCSMNGIDIPKKCALLISAVGTFFLGISLYIGEFLQDLLPAGFFRIGGGCLLCAVGLFQICKDLLGRILERHGSMCLHCKGIGLVIRICLDETSADADGSKQLSPGEAAAFSTAMSLDSLVSGMGAGLSAGMLPLCLLFTFVLGYAAVTAGCMVGKHCTKESRFSSVGGILLVLLGITRMLPFT